MFDIWIAGICQSWNRGLSWGVARGVIEHALQFSHEIKIIWDGTEISVEDFQQIPVFC
jgi:hypothetical protein